MQYSTPLARWFEEELGTAISEYDFSSADPGMEGLDADFVRSVRTYEDAGMMTNDRGLVVRLADGSEVRITIQGLANDPGVWDDAFGDHEEPEYRGARPPADERPGYDEDEGRFGGPTVGEFLRGLGR